AKPETVAGDNNEVTDVSDKTIRAQDADEKPASSRQDSKAGAAGSDNGGPKSTVPEVTDKTPYAKLLPSSDQPSSHQVDNAAGSARATLDDSGKVRQAEAVFRDGDGDEFRITATAESKIAEFWRRHILIS